MRPLGPLPATAASSMPSSRASRLAAGDARMRSPGLRGRAAGAGCGVDAAVAGTWAAAGAASPAAGGSSPASKNQPIRTPQGYSTPISPVCANTPLPEASISVSTLSVSTSSTACPAVTSAPSGTSQRRIVPDSIVRPSFGIANSMAIGVPLLKRPQPQGRRGSAAAVPPQSQRPRRSLADHRS